MLILTQKQEQGFSPEEERLYKIALAMPLDRKIEQAVGIIQLHETEALNLSPEGYYVAFSGGKDSIVMAKLFELAGVKYDLHYSNTTIDPPELTRFIRKEYPQVIWHNKEIPLPYYMERKSLGPPTRIARWCCEIYKETGGDGLFKAIGVRSSESPRRKKLWSMVTKNRRMGLVLCPIIYWTDKDIWDFIRSINMPYCCLYDEGFKRLGCVGCPMSGPKRQAADFLRWPKIERVWKKGFQKFWNKWKGVPTKKGKDRYFEKYKTVDEFWTWWITAKPKGKVVTCQLDQI